MDDARGICGHTHFVGGNVSAGAELYIGGIEGED